MRTPLKQPVDRLFPEARKRVLGLLFGAPGKRLHLRDIARRTGLAVGTVQRELKNLASAEIVLRTAEGNRAYYEANRDCPLFEELAGLVRKTVGLSDVVRNALSALGGKIHVAFIYGSHASGRAGASSDVDVLVVGDVDEMALHRAVVDVEERLDRPVNYTLLSRREFSRRRKEKEGFLARVLAGEKIAVIGNIDEI
jgi:predicted nucleotidyltransferase